MTDTYTIEFVDEGVTLEVSPDEPILEAAERAGLDLPYQCRMGICGVCCGKRLDNGDIDHSEGVFLDNSDLEEGYALLCIVRAKSDLEIRTNETP